MGRVEDDLLLAELGAALDSADPVPRELLTAARASLGWRRVDEELAALVDDSATCSLAGVRSRGTEAPRLLTFEAPGLTVEVEVTAHGAMRHLVGQLVPPHPADVEVRWPGGSATDRADDVGHFSVDAVPAGPVSVACLPHGAKIPVVTSWVTI